MISRWDACEKCQGGSSTLFGAYTPLFAEFPISELDHNGWVGDIKRDEGTVWGEIRIRDLFFIAYRSALRLNCGVDIIYQGTSSPSQG